jgi:hypothetical protein
MISKAIHAYVRVLLRLMEYNIAVIYMSVSSDIISNQGYLLSSIYITEHQGLRRPQLRHCQYA